MQATKKRQPKGQKQQQPKQPVVEQRCCLGMPANENDWLKYIGSCNIFAGTEQIEEEDGWHLEPPEVTIAKLTTALERVGIRCLHVEIICELITEGTRAIKCICEYNKPYYVHDSDFYLDGLTEFDFNRYRTDNILEFSFLSRYEEPVLLK